MKFLKALSFSTDTVRISAGLNTTDIDIERTCRGITEEYHISVDRSEEIILKQEEGCVILGLTDE